MGRKRTRPKKPEDVHTHLTIRVERHEASVKAAVNHNVYSPEYAWGSRSDDPLYQFTSRLMISGTCICPKERAGDTYELVVYGDDAPSMNLNKTLRDVQARDEYDGPLYRTYRGREIPIYNPPSGLASLDKVRGEPHWTTRLFVPSRFVNDMLALLDHRMELFLEIHERKEGRSRWVQGVSLESNNPEEE